MTEKTGVVVIGRNEGVRLKVCLKSVIEAGRVVYVDSGSTDDSINIAKQLSVEVVNLDISIPFTAARARNEGFQRLRELEPDLAFVQFVDGDCEVETAWFEQALTHLEQYKDVAVVCGRRRERYPHASVYNMLCDIEWNTAIGETKSCGGDALMRANVFEQVGGYNPDVIAGEEPELCVRIRQNNWKIWRIDSEMTLHDANITRFSQWWMRNVRAGYAFALGAQMHGAIPECHKVNEVKRTRIWGGVIPLVVMLASTINIVFLLGMIIYPLQVIRIALVKKQIVKAHWRYAFFVTLGKFPEMQGQVKFYLNKIFNSRSKIIEYKN